MSIQNSKLNIQHSSQSGDHLTVRIYSPEPLLGHPVTLIKNIWRDIMAGRELAWRLFIRDISAQYRQTFLGYIWVFLPPLVSSMTFIFLSKQGIVTVDTGDVPYPAFAMMGTLLWQTFVDALNTPPQSLGKAKSMLAKINFPREAIILGGFYNVIFNFSVRLLLVAGVMIYWKITPDTTILFFPVAMFFLMLCGMSLGLILTPLSTLYGDVQKSISMITGFWMFLTPVVYPARTEGIAGFLAVWNPISPMIVTARESLSGMELSLLGPFAIVAAGSILLTFLGLVAFRISMPHLIARMGG